MSDWLLPYLEQLDAAAARYGIGLKDAFKAAGKSSSTLSRWRRGVVAPSEREATVIMETIVRLGTNEGGDLERHAAKPADV